jgi:hypothetical protein
LEMLYNMSGLPKLIVWIDIESQVRAHKK